MQHGSSYVLLLNNDTVVENDFLDHLVEVAEKNENVRSNKIRKLRKKYCFMFLKYPMQNASGFFFYYMLFCSQ